MTHTEARKLASQCGTRMCDENGETHGEELYCFDLDDIIALKEALKQPEQVDCPRCGHVCSQREWVGLTEEEANLLWENTDDRDSWELIKRVEAKLKERNT